MPKRTCMKDKKDIEITKVKLSELKLDLANLRGHKDSEIDLIVRSLTIFGQFKPLIVDKATMTVKIGNGRLMAMRKMGWTECDCVLLDWEGNDGMEVVDNRLNEMSAWVDKSINKWFLDKGADWWGLDEETAPKVEKLVEKEAKRKDKEPKPPKPKEEKPVPLCPCCGKPLKRKERMVLD